LSFFKKIIANTLTLFNLIAIHPGGIDYAIPFIRPFNVLKSRYKFGGSRKNFHRPSQRRIMVLNFSILKKTIFLLLIVPVIFFLCACGTSRGTAKFEWAHGTVDGYHYQWLKDGSPSDQKVWKETARMEPWLRTESRHAFIQYKTPKDIEKLDNRIDFTSPKRGAKNLFSLKYAKDPVDSIRLKIDVLFDKVSQLLGMYGKKHKMTINLYPKKYFYEVRDRINGKNCRFRAMYIFEQNTIYINLEDVHEGILAHEIAHAIIDNYLSVRPPKTTSEILARYVEENLHY